MPSITELLLQRLQQAMQQTGQGVNRYAQNVGAATAPGAMRDLGSYAKQELTRYPGTTAQPEQGPMPKFDLVNNILTNLLGITGLNDPVSQMGGPGATAQISPMMWKAMQPEAKAMLNEMGSRFPSLFEKVLKSEIPLQAQVAPGRFVGGTGSPAYGTMSVTRPSVEMARKVGQPEMANKPMSAVMNIAEGEIPKGPGTAVHEAQHMLSFPKVAATEPADAATIGMLLHDLLPGPKGSLSEMIGKYKDVAPPGVANTPQHLVDNPSITKFNLAPWAGEATAGSPVNAGQGYYKPGESLQDYLSRAMMDEGRSYLAEQTLKPTGNPAMMNLANKLDVGTGLQPTAEPGWLQQLLQTLIPGQ